MIGTSALLGVFIDQEECRHALERNDISSAKQLYAELRDEFSKLKIDAAEKNAVYNSIRELYDDIHLAMLG